MNITGEEVIKAFDDCNKTTPHSKSVYDNLIGMGYDRNECHNALENALNSGLLKCYGSDCIMLAK